MPNYFTNFSVILPLNQTQQEYTLKLAAQVDAYLDDQKPLPSDFPEALQGWVKDDWYFEVEPAAEGVWLHSEAGGQEAACALIQHLLQQFAFAPSVSFEWSYDCSKPLPDAYGGGAAFITDTEIQTFTTSEWLEAQAASSPKGA
jgi:hypothetical protein